jgi:hypothetical protein
MLDLAPSSLGPTSPCVLPRHFIGAIRQAGEPKAELAIIVDFHLDRRSSPLFKASPACRLSRRYTFASLSIITSKALSHQSALVSCSAAEAPSVPLAPHFPVPHICLFCQMHACSALSNSLALCQCTPAHTLAKWRSHAFSSPRMKRRLPPPPPSL